MVKNHLKKIASPKSWRIKRKSEKFAAKPNPGAHSLNNSMPVSIIFKNLLKIAKTTKEVKYILNEKSAILNGKQITDKKMPAGLFDIFEFPDVDERYIILIDNRGKIIAKPCSKDMPILAKVKNKNFSKGKINLQLINGWNIFTDNKDIKTNDSVLLDAKTRKIKNVLKFEKGALAFLIGGRHVGHSGIIENIDKNKIILKIKGELVETLKKFVYVTGKDKPYIEL